MDCKVTLLKPSKLFVSYNPFVRLACVASVSNRVIARKLEREQTKKKSGRGKGKGEGKRYLLSLPPPPSFLFFALVPTFSTNSRGNACYASYRSPSLSTRSKRDNQNKLAGAKGSTSFSNKRSLNLTPFGG